MSAVKERLKSLENGLWETRGKNEAVGIHAWLDIIFFHLV